MVIETKFIQYYLVLDLYPYNEAANSMYMKCYLKCFIRIHGKGPIANMRTKHVYKKKGKLNEQLIFQI